MLPHNVVERHTDNEELLVMESLSLLRRASDFYRRNLAIITADQWQMHSVSEDWTVKDLADHVLGGNRFAVELLAGLDAEAAFGSALAQGFDNDPLTAYRQSEKAHLDAFEAPGALDLVLRHPVGDISGRQFLGFRIGEFLLHAWDLARSTGGDETLDDKLVAAVWEAYQPILSAADDHRAFGAGPSGTLSKDAPLSLRLLDLTGRRP